MELKEMFLGVKGVREVKGVKDKCLEDESFLGVKGDFSWELKELGKSKELKTNA